MNDKIQELMNQLIGGEIEPYEVIDALHGYVQGEIEIIEDTDLGERTVSQVLEVGKLKNLLTLLDAAYGMANRKK